jgi:hypothetical protein
MSDRHNYPAYKWHPETAEQRLFTKAAEVPEGWLDTHPDNLKNVSEPVRDAAGKIIKPVDAVDRDYPAMKWDPVSGEARTFTKAAEVPEGWLDTHPANVANVAKPAPDNKKVVEAAAKAAPLPLTRKEMVKALQDGGIAFDPAAKVDVLYAILTEAVKKFLTTAEIEFDPAMDTKALLALVPPVQE